MEPICPKCQSHHIEPRNLGRKTGSAVGVLAGAAMAVSGAAVVGTIAAGPAGAVIGPVAAALLRALAGGTAGCAVGAALGEVVDESILDNHRCLRCGHRFGIQRT